MGNMVAGGGGIRPIVFDAGSVLDVWTMNGTERNLASVRHANGPIPFAGPTGLEAQEAGSYRHFGVVGRKLIVSAEDWTFYARCIEAARGLEFSVLGDGYFDASAVPIGISVKNLLHPGIGCDTNQSAHEQTSGSRAKTLRQEPGCSGWFGFSLESYQPHKRALSRTCGWW